jgi:hypothetical protein
MLNEMSGEKIMTLFRIALFIVWVILIGVSVNAILQLGSDGGNVFFTDFAHPWRAQFNTDLCAHLLLMGTWVIYREPNRVVGVVLGILCAVMGGAVSLPYILVATFRAKGDVRKLLLGRHA